MDKLVGDRNKCSDCKNTNEREKAKKANEQNKASKDKKRQCNKCEKVLQLSKFDGDRKKCNSCRNNAELEKFKEKREGMTKFECSKCNEVLPIDMCESDRFSCKKCASVIIHKEPCYYCNGYDNKSKKLNGKSRINSVIDDFTDNNTVYSCTTCSNMKRSLSQDIFLQHIINIRNFNRKSGHIKYIDYNYPDEKRYAQYRYSADNKARVFELTEEDFKSIVKKPCYLCGDSDQNNGIDRKDNDTGYTIENSYSCCSTCNIMKQTLDHNDFIEHVSKIVPILSSKTIIPLDQRDIKFVSDK
jgi:hypothetical protein